MFKINLKLKKGLDMNKIRTVSINFSAQAVKVALFVALMFAYKAFM
jgi:hypothetical protein